VRGGQAEEVGVTALFICPRQNIRSRDGNPAAQPQRTGNEALVEAVTQIVSECSFRAGEWRRAGDVVMAQAFERVGAVVGGIE